MKITPLDYAQAEDFMSALTDEERTFLEELTAGYSLKEISQRNHIQYSHLPILRAKLKEKAVEYL
jgi:FixJ family two-component response regulator